MKTQDELFARVVAQQQQITALHTALSMALATYGEGMSLEHQRDIAAALNGSEPAGRADFEAAVAEAIEPRVTGLREELEAAHATALGEKDRQIEALVATRGVEIPIDNEPKGDRP